MKKAVRSHPEPVPAASQIAILPFLAAIEGYLLPELPANKKLRITFHRTMVREGTGYLQQVCTYLGSGKRDAASVGRIFPLTTGLMGLAAVEKRIYRTKHYSSIESLNTDLVLDLDDTKDNRAIETVPRSYLSIPILGPEGDSVLVLYADCDELNFFACNDRVQMLAAMCDGFCRIFDWIQKEQPFRNVRNFPLPKGVPAMEAPTGFKRIQEVFDKREPPSFDAIGSFNYDAFMG